MPRYALKNLPVRHKLTFIALVASAVALLLTLAGFVTHEVVMFRRDMVEDHSAVARMLADSTGSAVTFNDADAATQTLKAVAAYPHVLTAILYDRDGKVFATYRSNQAPSVQLPAAPTGAMHRWGANSFELYHPFAVAGEPVGTIYLHSELGEMRESLVTVALLSVGVLLVSGLAAYLMARWLQPLITGPVSHLAEVARTVAQERNYAVRATRQSADELGSLVDTFNAMLDQIQHHQSALREARDQLEARVLDRTRALLQEVSERRRSEEALRESNQRFETVTRATTDVVWDYDIVTNEIWWNENYQGLFGYSASDVPATIDGWQNCIHPEDAPAVMSGLHAMLESDDTLWSSEYRYLRSDGTYAYIFDRGYILRNATGKAVRVIGAMQDISDRKRAEQEVVREKARLQLIFESVPVGIAVDRIEPSGERSRILNDAHLRICGLSREEAVIGAFQKISHPDDYARQAVFRRQLEAGEIDRFSMEKRYLCTDGRLVWVTYSVQRERYADGGWQDLSTIVDITDLKQAEEAVAHERARFKFIFESVPVGITWMIRDDISTRVVNPAHAKITGVPAEQCRELERYRAATPPVDRARQSALHDRMLAGDIDHYQIEKRYVHADGSVRWTELSIRFYRDGSSGETQEISTLVDITDRKQAETRLAETHKQLLDTSRQAGMAEVATGVLHNVGNVLNSVNVSATLLADLVRQSKSSRVAKLADLFREQQANLSAFFATDPRAQQVPGFVDSLAKHLSREQVELLGELDSLRKNIEHIKDIVAMQQNYAKVSGVSESIAVTDLVEDALRMNAGGLARHDVALTCDFQARPTVTVEKHKVLQILVNLMRNAKYACEESGHAEKRMIVRVTADDSRVRIAVIDNGIGIPAENLTRIFAHGFTTRKHGHGFGLHSGALAAKELGGALIACSDGPGKGAVFTLELPYQLDARAA